MIGKHTLIEHVVFRALEAGYMPVVATDSADIVEVVMPYCNAILEFKEQLTGTDRVAHAANQMDVMEKHEFIVNLQGDMPFINPEDIKNFIKHLESVNIPRLTAFAVQEPVIAFPNSFARVTQNVHIGIYGFTRAALSEFHRKQQSPNEKKMRLEQMRVGPWEYFKFNTAPLEVNTQSELERARLCHRLS